MAEQEYDRSGEESQTADRPRGGRRSPRRFRAASILVLLTGVLAAGCSVPDHPLRGSPPLPPTVAAAYGSDRIRVLSPAPGVAYYGLSADEAPWAIHLLRVDMGRCELGLQVLSAPPTEGIAGGLATVSKLAAEGGDRVVAAVNGDFFIVEEGIASGAEVVRGDVRRMSDRPALAWRPGADPWMGHPRIEADTALVTGWLVPRARADGATEALGGFPLLLDGGERVGDLEVVARPAFAAGRHPRTAVGFDPDRDVLWVVVVDGRQPDHSAGMTLPELASLLEALGAREALNLDGGGSSVMVLRGVPVSRPSDPEGERAVANALAIRRDRGLCRLAH